MWIFCETSPQEVDSINGLSPVWYCCLEKRWQSNNNYEIYASFNIHVYECAVALRKMFSFSIATKSKVNIVKRVGLGFAIVHECKTM